MELDKNQHSVYSINYHLVMVIKYRRKVISDEISGYLRATFERIGITYGVELVEWNHDKDHVHVLFRGTLISQLKYKCAWYGKQLIIIDPKNTSRICHECKQKNHEFDSLSQSEWLAAREWDCPNCHAHLDRDVNAAKNILAKGLETLA